VGPRLKIVNLQRSVGDFHGVLVSSRVFSLPSGCSLWLPGILDDEVDNGWDDSWRG
jgi:hypothetical protein